VISLKENITGIKPALKPEITSWTRRVRAGQNPGREGKHPLIWSRITMDTLVIMAVILIVLVILAVFFVMKYSSRSGGNDDVWKPEDKKGPHPEG
jgi:hypothetical protein